MLSSLRLQAVNAAKTASVIAILYALVFPVASQAGPAREQAAQNVRIRQGLQSGELTIVEARQVKAQQQQTQKMAESFKADGVVTPREKCRLMNRNAKTNAQLYNQKHDGQSR